MAFVHNDWALAKIGINLELISARLEGILRQVYPEYHLRDSGLAAEDFGLRWLGPQFVAICRCRHSWGHELPFRRALVWMPDVVGVLRSDRANSENI